MKFITIPAGMFKLGWRFEQSALFTENTDNKSAINKFVALCSKKRSVDLPAFSIASEPIPISDLIGDPYDLEDDVDSLEALCNHVDEILLSKGLRLPTEDELEASAGGELFSWGNHIPDGKPYGKETSFVEHKKPNTFGLTLLGNPYKTELSRTALKFGDGGTSICGGDAWPLAWLTLSSCFRMSDQNIAECFSETLEECFIRPVRL